MKLFFQVRLANVPTFSVCADHPFSTHVMNFKTTPNATGDSENGLMDVDAPPLPVEPPEGPILSVRI